MQFVWGKECWYVISVSTFIEVCVSTRFVICHRGVTTHKDRLNHLVDRAVYRIFSCTGGEDIQFVRSVLDLPCLGACIKRDLLGF